MRELIMTIIADTDVLSIGGNPQKAIFFCGVEEILLKGWEEVNTTCSKVTDGLCPVRR